MLSLFFTLKEQIQKKERMFAYVVSIGFRFKNQNKYAYHSLRNCGVIADYSRVGSD
ncbi:hypothetical protein ES708_19256 [subsurface metagenome]